jgi:hypothetical protein
LDTWRGRCDAILVQNEHLEWNQAFWFIQVLPDIARNWGEVCGGAHLPWDCFAPPQRIFAPPMKSHAPDPQNKNLTFLVA